MTSLLASLMVASFFFTDTGNLYGTTTNGIPFSQVTVIEEPRIQEFKIQDVHWFICFDGTDTVTTEDLVELSKCVAN